MSDISQAQYPCVSNRGYCLVWATKVALAAICLVFPVLVLGYKSFNVPMYHVPVPTKIEIFVLIYFKTSSCWQHHFLTYKVRESPKYHVLNPT